jgi:hypothetical protein
MAQLVFKAAANDQSDRPEGLGIGLLAMQASPKGLIACAVAVVTMCVRMQYDAWRIQYRNFANTLIWCRATRSLAR